jgi:hypothetical protein
VQGTPAHDPAKAAAVLAEARQALGGHDRLNAVERLEFRGKSARVMMGSNIVEGDFEFQLELPGKFQRKESLGFSNNERNEGVDVVQVLNEAAASQKIEQRGGGDWENSSSSNNSRGRGRGNDRNFIAAVLLGTPSDASLDPRAQEEALHQALAAEMARVTLGWLLRTTEEIAWIGTAQGPDGKADVLETKTPDGNTVRLLISEKSRLPVMLAWTGSYVQINFNNRNSGQRGGRSGGPALQANKGPLQVYLSDYKTVNGIKLPHLIQRGHNDETTEELVVRNYRLNPTFKAGTFDRLE